MVVNVEDTEKLSAMNTFLSGYSLKNKKGTQFETPQAGRTMNKEA